MSKTALLVLDMQKDCRAASSCKPNFDGALWRINDISQMFRKQNLPVVIIQHLEMGGPRTEGFACVDELLISEKDYRVEKNFYNSFWRTELDEILKKEEVDCVVVCGFAAEYCVVATCNGAIERGYRTLLLQNGVTGFGEESVKQLQLSGRPYISVEALKYFLEK